MRSSPKDKWREELRDKMLEIRAGSPHSVLLSIGLNLLIKGYHLAPWDFRVWHTKETVVSLWQLGIACTWEAPNQARQSTVAHFRNRKTGNPSHYFQKITLKDNIYVHQRSYVLNAISPISCNWSQVTFVSPKPHLISLNSYSSSKTKVSVCNRLNPIKNHDNVKA